MNDARERRGLAMVALAGVFWSLQGVTVRIVEEASAAQIVFWRSVAQITVMLAVVALVNRGHVVNAFRRGGGLAAAGGLSAMVAGTSFIFALVHTTVANVVFILAAAPLLAAAGGWLLMRERLEARTLGAMLLALLGIGVMMSEGLASGSFAGYLFAMGAAAGFAGIAVVARRGGGTDMLPMACWGGAFNMVVAFTLAGGDLAVSLHDMAACFVSGGLLTAGGATCFMQGARYVPAGVLAFLSLTEIVLAPIWVWVGFDEVPSAYTLAGGAIVLAAIIAEAALRMRSRGTQPGGAAHTDS